jgi:hypothetical protein
MTAHYSDQQILNWIEENADEIVVTRDLSAGVRVTLSYCAASTGCQVEAQAGSLRAAAVKAIEHEADRERGDDPDI